MRASADDHRNGSCTLLPYFPLRFLLPRSCIIYYYLSIIYLSSCSLYELPASDKRPQLSQKHAYSVQLSGWGVTRDICEVIWGLEIN